MLLPALFDAETGRGAPPWSAMRAARWAALEYDAMRTVLPHGDPAITALNVMDVDSRLGELLLVAGSAHNSPGGWVGPGQATDGGSEESGYGGSRACVGVYYIGNARELSSRGRSTAGGHLPSIDGSQQPLAWATASEAATTQVSINAACWLPWDTTLFVSGTSAGTVSVWDTEVFQPCAHFRFPSSSSPGSTLPSSANALENARGRRHGSRLTALSASASAQASPAAPISALHMSAACGGRSELIAVASSVEQDLKLLDLNSGAFVHTVTVEQSRSTLSNSVSAGLHDVRWSPTNPYLLATAGGDGTARVFDIRRAGPGACLCVYDMYKSMAQAVSETKAQCSIADRSAAREAKRQRRDMLLDLGPAWERADDTSAFSSRKRAQRRALMHGGTSGSRGTSRAGSARGTVSHKSRISASLAALSHAGGASRVRFTPDGVQLVTGGADRRVRVWDVHTGHCLTSSFSGASGETVDSFEVSNDGSVLLSGMRRALMTHSLSNGHVLSLKGNHLGEITALAVHPTREEVYSASRESEIFCWAPRRAALQETPDS